MARQAHQGTDHSPKRITRSVTKAMKEEAVRSSAENSALSFRRFVVFLGKLLLVLACLAGSIFVVWKASETDEVPQYLMEFRNWLGVAKIRSMAQAEEILNHVLALYVDVGTFLRNLDLESVKEYVVRLNEIYGAPMVYSVAGTTIFCAFLSLAYLSSKRSREKMGPKNVTSKDRLKQSEKSRDSLAGKNEEFTNTEDEIAAYDDEFEDEDELELENDIDVDVDEAPRENISGDGDMIFVQKKLTPQEYEEETESATNKEVIELLKSAEFRKLMKERGKDDAAFNWQKRRSARLAEQTTSDSARRTAVSR